MWARAGVVAREKAPPLSQPPCWPALACVSQSTRAASTLRPARAGWGRRAVCRRVRAARAGWSARQQGRSSRPTPRPAGPSQGVYFEPLTLQPLTDTPALTYALAMHRNLTQYAVGVTNGIFNSPFEQGRCVALSALRPSGGPQGPQMRACVTLPSAPATPDEKVHRNCSRLSPCCAVRAMVCHRCAVGLSHAVAFKQSLLSPRVKGKVRAGGTVRAGGHAQFASTAKGPASIGRVQSRLSAHDHRRSQHTVTAWHRFDRVRFRSEQVGVAPVPGSKVILNRPLWPPTPSSAAAAAPSSPPPPSASPAPAGSNGYGLQQCTKVR